MIKKCGLLAVLLGLYGFNLSSDLWFVQASLIGFLMLVSESVYVIIHTGLVNNLPMKPLLLFS